MGADDAQKPAIGKGGEASGKDRPRGQEEASATKPPPPPAVPFYKLFSFADPLDYILMVLGTLGAIVHGAGLPAFFLFFGKLINNFGDNDISAVQSKCLLLLYLGIVVCISGLVEVSCWMSTGERQSARIRAQYLKHTLMQEVAFFDKESSSGEIVSRISSDALLVQDAISEKVGNFLHFMSTFVAGFVIGFTSSWKLTLILLAAVPLIAACGGIYAYILVGLTNKSQKIYAEAGAVAEQTIGQIRTVYSFAGEEKALQKYSLALQNTLPLGYKSGLAKGLGMGVTYCVLFGAWALEFWYGGIIVSKNEINGGDALSAMFSVIIGGLSLGQAAPNLAAFAQGKAAAYNIFQMISRKSQIDSNDLSGTVLPSLQGDIELRNVFFSYPARPDAPIFQDFTLKIPSGRTMALVGSSGSGKSTVVSLLERFYDPVSGQILVDGYDIKTFQLKWYRNQLGLVSQEPVLFATTIKENILYGKDDATEEEIVNACKAANAYSFIQSLPDGLDTNVGDRGVQLSGGQKQRVAIARAILKNPKILLLDEATSALDSESEKIVQEALDSIMVGRTTVIIAHRLSTIRNSDAIAVVSKGRIVEIGSHNELMNKGDDGAYYSLVHMQTQRKESTNSEKSQTNAIASANEESGRRISLQQSTLSEAKSEVEKHTNDLSPVNKTNVWLRLLKLCLPEWLYGLLATSGAVMAGSVNPLFGLFLTSVIVAYFQPTPSKIRSEVNKWCVVFVIIGALTPFIYALQHYNFGAMGERLTKHIRELMFQSILKNEVGWFDREENSTGAIAARLASDATLIKGATSDRLSVLAQNLSVVIIAFSIGLILQWKMSLVVIATFPLLIAAAMAQQAFVKGFSGDLKKSHEKASQVAGEAVGNIRTVAAFSAESKILHLFNLQLEGPLKHTFKKGLFSGAAFGISQLCMYGAYGLGLYYGTTLVPEEASFSEVFKVFMVMIITAFAIAETLTLAPDLAKGGFAVRSIFSLLDRQTEIDSDNVEGIKPEKVQGQIELRKIKFAYPSRPEIFIFQNFDLVVPAGRTVALVGASGSGKSSVISLIERFYDPLEGRVLIDGKDIKSYNLRALRKFIGLVSQEPALFSISIRENILYGKDNATESEIIEAARSANAHNFISGFPNGYDTEVGERGVQMSGGQKQRIAIARAVLKNPSILLLDEATSALDSESEKVVQEALDRLMVGRTTVVIAHRLSTIKNADIIAVVQQGKIVEQGSHNELIAKGAAYFSLVNLQQNVGGDAL